MKLIDLLQNLDPESKQAKRSRSDVSLGFRVTKSHTLCHCVLDTESSLWVMKEV
jgi:hypothetical protein